MGDAPDLSRLTTPIETAVTGGLALLALVVVVGTWVRTRSIVPTLGMIVVAAFSLWAVNNVEFIQQRIIGPDLPEPSGVIEGAGPRASAPALEVLVP